MAESKTVLIYWSVRGLAQPIRNLLTYCNVKFEDKRFSTKEEWIAIKSTLKTDFPNTPCLIQGDQFLTESDAILTEIALKYKPDLLGSTNEERVIIMQLIGVIRDVKNHFSNIIYNKDSTDEMLNKTYDDNILPIFQRLVKKLGSNKFLIGKISVADFLFVEFLNNFYAINSKRFFEKVPTLKEYFNNFNSLPELKDYLNSDLVKNTPIVFAIRKPKGLNFFG